jgi:vacuolar-type H+-ATPase subunit H
VASVDEILRRFRFLAVPGAPAPAGVPVDRAAALESELAPVFASLEPWERRVREMTEEAASRAVDIRAEGTRRAQALLAAGAAEAARASASSASAVLAEADEKAGSILDIARHRARRVPSSTDERVVALAAEVVRRVVGELP